jgi:hypothetical protein
VVAQLVQGQLQLIGEHQVCGGGFHG